jgi:hypothetical protein
MGGPYELTMTTMEFRSAAERQLRSSHLPARMGVMLTLCWRVLATPAWGIGLSKSQFYRTFTGAPIVVPLLLRQAAPAPRYAPNLSDIVIRHITFAP